MKGTSARLPFVLLGVSAVLACAAGARSRADDGAAEGAAQSPTVAEFRSRSSFGTDADYGKYVQTTLRVGYRVRASVDYQNVKKGMTGTYYGTNGGEPPCLVVWDPDIKGSSTLLPNVPASMASHAYWVHWHEVEITGTHR